MSYLTPCRVPHCDIPGDSYAGVKGAVRAGLVLQSHCRNIATIGVILLGRNTINKLRNSGISGEKIRKQEIYVALIASKFFQSASGFLAIKKGDRFNKSILNYQLTKFRYSFAVLVLSRLLVLSMFFI